MNPQFKQTPQPQIPFDKWQLCKKAHASKLLLILFLVCITGGKVLSQPPVTPVYQVLIDEQLSLQQTDSAAALLAIAILSAESDSKRIANQYFRVAKQYEDAGSNLAAYEHYKNSLHFQDTVTRTDLLGRTYNNLGIFEEYFGNYEEAEKYYKNALLVFETVHGKTHLNTAIANNNLAIRLESRGLYTQASHHYAEFKAIAETLNLPQQYIAITDLNIAGIDRALGNYSNAIDRLHRVIFLFSDPVEGNKEYTALAYQQMANTYLDMGADAMVEENYKKALQFISQAGADPLTESDLYHNLGIFYHQSGRHTEAQESLIKADSILLQHVGAAAPSRAATQVNLGELYIDLGAYSKAGLSLMQALATFQKTYGIHHPDIAQAWNDLAKLALKQHKVKDALDYTGKASFANCSDCSDPAQAALQAGLRPYFEGKVYFNTLMIASQALFTVYEESAEPEPLRRALSQLSIADNLLFDMRNKVQTQADKLFIAQSVAKMVTKALYACHQLYSITGDDQYIERAFYFSQIGKNQVLLQSLSESTAKETAGIPGHILQEEKSLKGKIIFYEQQLALDVDSAAQVRNRLRLYQYRQAYQSYIRQMEEEFPAYYTLKYSRETLTTASVTQALAKDAALIDYTLADTSLYLITFSRKGAQLQVRNLDTPIDRLIKALKNTIIYKSQQGFAEISSHLYKVLVPELKPAINKLIIIPDAALAAVPFEVLLQNTAAEEYAEMDYLIADYDISYSYSPLLYMQQEKKHRHTESTRILAMAPIFSDESGTYIQRTTGAEVSPLPGTEREVQKIGDLFSAKGIATQCLFHENASKKTLDSMDLSGIDYLHFATHGYIDQQQPQLSGLLFAADSSATGTMLYMDEIASLSLDARLVTLSACETALGKELKGEGTIGLTQAFIRAGADNIIVSLWKVADESTAEFMVDFYTRMLRHRENDLQASLNAAKRQMIKSTEYAAPYYWSPFILIGK